MPRLLLVLLLLGSSFLSCGEASAAPTSFRADAASLWWDGFSEPAMDGEVHHMVVFRGDVIAAGTFDFAAKVRVGNVARLTSQGWVPLASGLDGGVTSLFVHGDRLIAGGRFSHAGGVEARGVASWDGQRWSPMGAGFGHSAGGVGEPIDFANFGGSLIAAGTFSNSGSTLVRNVARWNGSGWEPLGDGLQGPTKALAVHAGLLFAGGDFDTAGAVPASSLAQWDGTRWSAVGVGVFSQTGGASVLDLAIHGGELIVAGEFDHAGATNVRNIAAWNGVDWRPLGDGFTARTQALLSRGGVLLADDESYDQGYGVWNGSTWSRAGDSVLGTVEEFADAPGGFFVAGDFRIIDPVGGDLPLGFQVARESGDLWLPVTPWSGPMHGIGIGSWAGALAAYQGGILAVGAFPYVAASSRWEQVDGLALWKDGAWSAFPPPPASPWNVGVLLPQGETLYAGGRFIDYSTVPPRSIPVFRYDGSGWTALDTLSSVVTSLVFHVGTLYAGGRAVPVFDLSGGLFRWTGSAWLPVAVLESADDEPARVEALVEFEGRLVVGGHFSRIDGVPVTNVAAWDGTQWHAMGSNLVDDHFDPVNVLDLAVHEGRLYAAGQFGHRTLGRWDGTEWEMLGPRGVAVDLESAPGSLYLVGGLWDEITRVSEGVYRWDGTTWDPIGLGLYNTPHDAVIAGGSLYVGGFIRDAGGRSSHGFARWDGVGTSIVPRPAVLSAGRPNPFSGSIVFELSLFSEGHVRATVHDIAGREIRLLQDRTLPARRSFFGWDGTNAAGQRVPSGVYFIRVTFADGRTESARAVFLR